MIMCLALGLRHNLSWAAMVDTLTMINHLFNREVVKATKYFFRKYMEAGKNIIGFHLYCPYCERYLGLKEELTENKFSKCSCGTELKDINEASTYFLSLSLQEQIKDLLADKNFVKGLSYRFNRKKINEDSYDDIFDGEVYRKLSGPNQVLSEKYNFSYMINTDGFPVGGKSGKQTCWPIYIQFLELPPKMRSKYMLLAGIYVGKKDPNMKIFMYPFVEEANALSSVGVDWCLNGRPINSKVIPLCVCVDSPARAKILNMTQFNGWYGCTICHCKAESTDSGLRYTVPFNGLNERTHEEILVNAAQAHAYAGKFQNKKKRFVQGVKGLTPLHTMTYIDLGKGVRGDTIHSKLLGNANHHTSLLHDTAGAEFYIGSDVRKNAVSERLLSIKPPSSIMRAPRSLQQLSLWKATEWRSWMLFYGVVCLQGIIPDKYVQHFSMLSTSLHIILQKSITPRDLHKAHVILLRYIFLYQEYFGKSAMVFNVHLLLHTKRDIECLGPAWTNTAFGFEGANKTLLQMKKGVSSIAKEIARKCLIFKAFPLLADKYTLSESATQFCEKLSGRSLKSYQRIGKAVLVGAGCSVLFDPEEYNCVAMSGLGISREATKFDRFIHDGIRYSTSSYSLSSKHDDSFISIRGETKGQIQTIFAVANGNERSVYLLVRELILSDEPLFNDEYGRHSPIKKIDSKGSLFLIKPDDYSMCGNVLRQWQLYM